MVVYGSFVLAFFGASAAATGNPRWWLAGWLGPLAAVSDAVENALLLSINADMAAPEAELAGLPLPVWIKFVALALACGLAGWALLRAARLAARAAAACRRRWRSGSGLAAPLHWGEAAVGTIALAWIAMLGWAAWRTLARPENNGFP